ncbi:RNA polymerase sigma factor [Ureibacillus thermophilus]|uniref:RNA polymerase sigma factor n=1 Tax=Ureibacillus thermophilus TaxID=367743 RepID=A0A4P6UVD5_9BACL|nr:RNA polymerase sigma factor [Ureibacillus thermophilus]QBK25898.1 RNA polymerase sigma factor [Ureibacillus thermophilus]
MDEELRYIRQILAGDKRAYIHIINQYKNPLYATILRMTKNPQTAEDMLQEVFIKVYERLPKYDQKGPFKSWLYRIAINHCIDELRKKRIQTEQMEEAIIQSNETPEVVLLQNEKSRELEKMLSTLPEEERIILLLRYTNDLSYAEISDALGISIMDVRNKLYRAKKKLRKNVQEGGVLYGVSERG